MKYLLLLLTLTIIFGCSRRLKAPVAGYRLVWSDEFDREGRPDGSRWSYDLGGGGWGNNELEFYTDRPENARVEDGRLIIEARREKWENRDYTSARLVTRDRQTWTYGYIEVRAKLPSGRGTWPAIWTLGENIGQAGWPDCGEIDIMEHVGFNPGYVHSSVHTDAFNHVEGTQRTDTIYLADAQSTFHTYAIDWTPERIRALVDGKVYFSFDKPAGAGVAEWPFDEPQYLLLNLAVGGNWGGARGVDETIWPRRMEVDWVRVWQ